MSTKENKMGTMPVKQLIISMSLPMMISMLVQALYNVVDSIFVARLSEEALTAVTLAFPLQNLMIALGSGTGVGINALLSRSLGEKRYDRSDAAAANGLFLTFCNFLAFLLIGLFLTSAFVRTQTQDTQINVAGIHGIRRYQKHGCNGADSRHQQDSFLFEKRPNFVEHGNPPVE
jgi:Na+-driven multidrug efflux pump